MEKLLMPIVYVYNGKETISEEILPDIPISCVRGVMVNQWIELVINEWFENYSNAEKIAQKIGGELLSTRDLYLLKASKAKIDATCETLKQTGLRYFVADTIKGSEKFLWCREYNEEELKFFDKPYRHYGMCLETANVKLLPNIMHFTTRIVIRH